MKKLFLLFTLVPLAFVQANLVSLRTESVGSVKLPDGAASAGDFIIAVFSDSLNQDPALNEVLPHLPSSEFTPLSGCLSVARLQLHSLTPTLQKPGLLTFGCSDIPEHSSVYGWFNQAWEKMPYTLSSDGSVTLEFTTLTTYAIFPTKPQVELTNQNTRI